MVSLGTREALKLAVTGMILMLAAPHGAAEQPDAVAERQQQTLDTAREVIARVGPQSADLLEPLMALAMLYLESGDDNLAAATIERAVQIVRVNSGLHTLDQAPLIQQLIHIQEARGDHAAAWELEQNLLTLARRHPDDLRAVRILRESGDKQMQVLADFLADKNPPQVVLGCFYKKSFASDDGNCSSGSRKTAVHGMLGEAQRHYSDAIAVMLRHELYGSDELRELEMDLLRVIAALRVVDSEPSQSHLTLVPQFGRAEYSEPWRSRTASITALAAWTPPHADLSSLADRDIEQVGSKRAAINSYHRGWQSLSRMYAYAGISGDSLRQAEVLLQMADWELLYGRNGEAVARYERARAMLTEAGAAQAAMERAFAPATPVVLPDFEANPLARDETREPTGHIDVSFEITKFGRGRSVEILGTANATDDALERLEKLIATRRFRPRLTNGEFADATPLVIRYYIYD